MDTALEALFRAINGNAPTYLSDDDHNGDAEAPGGAFCRVVLDDQAVTDYLKEFSEITDAYGVPDRWDMLGNWVISLSDQGIVSYQRFDTRDEMNALYEGLEKDYLEWAGVQD